MEILNKIQCTGTCMSDKCKFIKIVDFIQFIFAQSYDVLDSHLYCYQVFKHRTLYLMGWF